MAVCACLSAWFEPAGTVCMALGMLVFLSADMEPCISSAFRVSTRALLFAAKPKSRLGMEDARSRQAKADGR